MLKVKEEIYNHLNLLLGLFLSIVGLHFHRKYLLCEGDNVPENGGD